MTYRDKTAARKIKVSYSAVDAPNRRATRTYATLKGAMTFAHNWVGPHPEIGSGYAVSGDGIGKVTVRGATLAELFPPRSEPIVGRERIVLASVLGGTNLGMSLPDKKLVGGLLSREDPRGRPLNIESATVCLWQDYMESEAMLEMFVKECKWWLDDNLDESPDGAPVDKAYVRRVWPDVAGVMGWS